MGSHTQGGRQSGARGRSRVKQRASVLYGGGRQREEVGEGRWMEGVRGLGEKVSLGKQEVQLFLGHGD